MLKALVPLFFGMFLSAALAYSPDGCMVEDMVGNWTFYMDEGGHDENYNCAYMTEYVSTFQFELLFPNKVVDMYGNEGTWTMVDSYGFEVVVHGRKYFAPVHTEDITYYCNKTATGISHDIMNRDWFCYHGQQNGPGKTALTLGPLDWSQNEEFDHMMYKVDESVIERINSDNNILWYAKKYEQFEKMTVGQMKKLMGQKKRMNSIKPAVANQELKNEAGKLPKNFDWRNVDGVNYISPVRHQGHCGSCYAFASAGMNEARLNIATRGTINVTLSPQDVVDCSMYTFGCGGGIEYLAGGTYAEDHGMVEESCYPYRAEDGKCRLEKRDKCKKYYFTGYEYVGGYFGVCNEEAMKVALMHGPITVAIQSSKDLRHYAGGIYHKTDFELNPYYPTNHAVLIVGYGVEESTNTKYWIVKNSWGEDWGEQGYFRIRRGTNEIGIETSAFQAFPIF